MQEIAIKANNIDGAVEEIIGFLEHTRQWGVIYVDGWLGSALGASAILNALVKQLRSPLSRTATRKAAGLDKIIHIDCSLWQNKRSLQKAIAKELRLPQEVMAFFDQGDEEDDFDGIEQVARGVIPHVKWAILNELSNCKFLVVFHNGSGNYVDLWECGVPVMGVMSKRVLWASQGRFLLHHSRTQEDVISMEELAGLSDVAIWVSPHIYINKNAIMNENDIILHFLLAEADEVARYSGVPGPNSSKIVLECIFYKVLRRNYNIDWGIHAANYWVCDGIIEDENDYGRPAWEIGDALHKNINLDWSMSVMDDLYRILRDTNWRHSEHWVSLTSQDEATTEVSKSFFTFDNMILVGGMFEQSYMSKLRVLHLSHCIFSYSSPPFLGCSNLRFLLLDHCEDKKLEPHDGQKEGCSQDIKTCFHTLWVLELSYTNWHWLLSKEMLDLMVELRELNVKGANNMSMRYLHHCSGSKSSIIKLRVVVTTKSIEDDELVQSTQVLTRSSNKDYGINGVGDNRDQVSSFPDISSWHFLKSIILDGCGELEEIGYNALPPSLESFSFTNNIAATRIKSICFSRCAKLKSMLLTGWFGSLVELDMSDTLVKTLDLRAVKALGLRKIFLLGCENLYAILWPWKENKKIELEVLLIDTTHVTWDREYASKKEESTNGNFTSIESSLVAVHGNDKSLAYSDSYISLRDPRLFRSLLRIKLAKFLHVKISSIGGHKGVAPRANDTTCSYNELPVPLTISLQETSGSLYSMDDIISTFKDNSDETIGANGGDVVDIDIAPTAIMWMWPCPPIPMNSSWVHCYISIQDETPPELHVEGYTTSNTRQETRITLPSFVHERTKILHLHDSLSITSIPGAAPTGIVDLNWDELVWCRVERCPSLEGSVFTPPSIRENEKDIFKCLETFWASQLQNVRYIWHWGTTFILPGEDSFHNLTFLHLEHCPRLVHVLPLYISNDSGCYNLETLEIVCCCELKEVFPTDTEVHEQKPREFPRLKRIHLYELPMLEHIYRHHMLARNLETVKIRGCWSLKRLPAVRRPPRRRHRLSTVAEAELLDSVVSLDGFESDEDKAQSTLPTVDCEEDWWNGLEWSGEEFGHHPWHYKPCHSAYHKRTLLRASVLR